MAKDRERCKWVGTSGLCYTYIVLRLPCKLHAGQQGNYVFAKRNAEGKWVPVYIGHGELSIACTPYNPQWECILSHGATHFHCHLNEQEQASSDEQDDLLSRYKNAYAPYGCNIAGAGAPAGKGEGSSIIDLDLLQPDAPGDSDISPMSGPDDSSETRAKP